MSATFVSKNRSLAALFRLGQANDAFAIPGIPIQ